MLLGGDVRISRYPYTSRDSRGGAMWYHNGACVILGDFLAHGMYPCRPW